MEPIGRLSYSRKEKSLGVLVSNFLTLYNHEEDGGLIGLDDAADTLGVERRRIYDVVNIVESIGLITRRGKNQYSWRGFGAIPPTLDELKEEGMKEKFGIIPCVTNSEMVFYEEEREESFMLTPDDLENSQSPKLECKKEKTLWLLAQNFVKLFLCSDDDLITLDGATKALLNDSQDPLNRRNKVRRLYDIANVFSSMNLIEKTHTPETKRAAYRWLGYEAIDQNRFVADPATLCERIESKKRLFGTEITNLNAKRKKTDGSKTPIVKVEEECETKPDVKSLMYGPVTPASTIKKENVGTSTLAQIEALSATFRPRYGNPELLSLLGHFTETWNTWFERAGRK